MRKNIKNFMGTKGQVWGLDVMMAVALFLVSIMIFFTYTINYSEESSDEFKLLTYDGESISASLLSEGYPKNWDSSNVQTIGLTTNGEINQTKLDELYSMIYVDGNYTLAKRKFNTIYDFYFFFEENMTANSIPIDGIGKPGVSRNSIDAKNLVKRTRLTFYKNKTTPLYIYIWN